MVTGGTNHSALIITYNLHRPPTDSTACCQIKLDILCESPGDSHKISMLISPDNIETWSLNVSFANCRGGLFKGLRHSACQEYRSRTHIHRAYTSLLFQSMLPSLSGDCNHFSGWGPGTDLLSV